MNKEDWSKVKVGENIWYGYEEYFVSAKSDIVELLGVVRRVIFLKGLVPIDWDIEYRNFSFEKPRKKIKIEQDVFIHINHKGREGCDSSGYIFYYQPENFHKKPAKLIWEDYE